MPDPTFAPSSKAFQSDDVPFTDYDAYDAEVFKLPSFSSLAWYVSEIKSEGVSYSNVDCSKSALRQKDQTVY